MTNSIKIQAGFKYRIYPNQEQQQKLAVQFGHSRFVYNLYLSVRSDYYAATGKNSGYHDCANDLTQLKKEPEHAWLKEADSQALQQSLKDLDTAFQRFFRGKGGCPNATIESQEKKLQQSKQSVAQGSCHA